MAIVEKSISINSPVEKVFGYFETPDFLLKCVPSLVEVKVWEPLPTGGHRFQCVHKMGGLQVFAGPTKETEFVPNQRIVQKGEGPFLRPRPRTSSRSKAVGQR